LNLYACVYIYRTAVSDFHFQNQYILDSVSADFNAILTVISSIRIYIPLKISRPYTKDGPHLVSLQIINTALMSLTIRRVDNRSHTLPLVEEEVSPISEHISGLGNNKNMAIGPEIKNGYAGEAQQQITALLGSKSTDPHCSNQCLCVH
jgi:hypothetical protein